jgi:O-antigen/teichoic acid export membrane protein
VLGAFGDLRAVQSVFAPVMLIIPALAMPSLPALARAARDGDGAQRSVDVRLSGLALGAALLYVMAMIGMDLLPLLFGQRFERSTELLWHLAEVAAPVGIGMGLLLTARQRGDALLLNRALGGGGELALVAPLSAASGAIGAALAGAMNSIASTLTRGGC